jgi:hypothetical protein
MKAKISDRPMFKKPTDETDVENVGIMQGFMDSMEEDDSEDEYEMDDNEATKVADRRPNSPEILMNNLRGDMRSIDARVEELADLVGYNAAADTPEDVLALLQPVFAQQQAVPMPPQGGIPPAPMPQGMPEMAPEGMPMPPEASMGGIGALATDQGAMAQEPMTMARGGYVQHFSDGTDEDGVTPTTDTSSYTYPADWKAASQYMVEQEMSQKPLKVPDLRAGMESRVPLYEQLLGVDPKQSQAQILFELGNRAFNYAANVDDQGRPLQGSQAARLAGAVRTLPTAMGAITADIEKNKRAVKMAALQATEKDIQDIRGENTKLINSQRSMWKDVFKQSMKDTDKGFGAGVEGVAQTTLYKFAPAYANGTLSEENTRKFESALQIIQTPTQFTNTYTGNIETRTPQLPEYVKTSITARNTLSGMTPKVAPSSVEVPPSWTGGELPADELASLQTAAQKGNVEAQQALLSYERSTKTPVAPVAPVAQPTAVLPTSSLWKLSGSMTGPVSALQAGAARIPGQGGSFPAVTQARAYAETAINGVVSALRTTDRFGNSEREEIKSDLGLNPQLFDDPAALRNRLIGVGAFIEQERDLAEQQLQTPNLPVELRKTVATRLEEMKNALKILDLPPKIYSVEEAAKLGPNVEFLWNGTTPMRTK